MPGVFELYRSVIDDPRKPWRWRLVTEEGDVTLPSACGFVEAADARGDALIVRDAAASADIHFVDSPA